ncbi:putative ABC transport system permease protein [Chitinophaga skermanii]|uniref:Putative ABC transport system permease protein n=1 Tax=Chitinophaga skermanii TaxID=331697 RepID=A0A327R497_9BACT|nr:ABC transporter permease [Chitinophaga skermanii]RAJ10553.1 putative ABC transport system permease protein [Chitinophaga skermanii]
MFTNFFKIVLRNLVKHRSYAMINIAGLAIGLIACWTILLYIYDEWSFDRHYPKANRIARIVEEATWPRGELRLAPSSAPMGPAIKNDYPEVEAFVRFLPEGGNVVAVGENKIPASKGILITDPTAFQVFDFVPVAGDVTTALQGPGKIVLTKSMAANLFTDPALALNKEVKVDNETAIVSAVIEDQPASTHLQFSALRSKLNSIEELTWQNFELYTYVLLREGVNMQQFEQKVQPFYQKYLHEQMGVTSFHLGVQPLTAIHLHSHLDYELTPNSNIQYVYIFLMVALLVLIIACINYMNLATARSTLRLKEVGVRKTLGSNIQQLTKLFLTESFIVTSFAALLGVGGLYVLLPYFNDFTDKHLFVGMFGWGYTILIFIGFIALISLMAGLYPALFMARTNVMKALQSGKTNAHSAFRKSLVIFQFVIAIALIAISILTYQQLRFVSKTNLGFNRDQTLSFHINNEETRRNIQAFKEEIMKSPHIESVASSSNEIGTNYIGARGYWVQNDAGEMPDGSVTANQLYIDGDFLKTMDIQLGQGRNFAFQTGDQYSAVMVNEAFIKKIGLKNPLGKKVEFKIDQQGTKAQRQIVGVVKDFHIYSLQHKIEPLILLMPPVREMEDNLFVRFKKGQIPEALAWLKKVYAQFDHENPFSYTFVDENFAKQYKSEQQQSQVLLIFTALAVFIACLGLFGLAAFMAEQRTKEIGIRKTLGASVQNIVGMLSADFMKLVFIAVLLALPLAWWAMSKWLQSFAYHVQISWWIFIIAGLLAFIVALMTIGYQAVKAATVNPVKSLRAQ